MVLRQIILILAILHQSQSFPESDNPSINNENNENSSLKNKKIHQEYKYEEESISNAHKIINALNISPVCLFGKSENLENSIKSFSCEEYLAYGAIISKGLVKNTESMPIKCYHMKQTVKNNCPLSTMELLAKSLILEEHLQENEIKIYEQDSIRKLAFNTLSAETYAYLQHLQENAISVAHSSSFSIWMKVVSLIGIVIVGLIVVMVLYSAMLRLIFQPEVQARGENSALNQ